MWPIIPYILHFFFIIDQTFLFSYSGHWSTSHDFTKRAHLENAYTLNNIFFFIIDQTFLFSCSWHWSTSHEFKKKCTMKKRSKLFVFKTFVSTSINQFSIDHSYFCISQKLPILSSLFVSENGSGAISRLKHHIFSSFNTICLKIFVKTTMSYLCIHFGTTFIRLLRYYVRT